jgi:hypothetical protein
MSKTTQSSGAAVPGVLGVEGGAPATAKILAPSGTLPSALCSSKRSKEDSGLGTTSTPSRPPSKVSRPQGTSPMAQDGDSMEVVDMVAYTGEEEESMAKSDPRSTNDNTGAIEGEQDSIGRAIAGVRKDLFRAEGTSGSSTQGTMATSK